MIDIRKAQEAWTSIGKIKTPVNARVSKGEHIIDTDANGIDHAATVTQGKEHADDQLANLSDQTAVIGGRIDPRTGVEFYKNPIDKLAIAGQNTIDKLKYNLLRKYKSLGVPPGQLGLTTWDLTNKQTEQMSRIFTERMEDTKALLKQVGKYDELMLYARRYSNGKNPLTLPGFNVGGSMADLDAKLSANYGWKFVTDKNGDLVIQDKYGKVIDPATFDDGNAAYHLMNSAKNAVASYPKLFGNGLYGPSYRPILGYLPYSESPMIAKSKHRQAIFANPEFISPIELADRIPEVKVDPADPADQALVAKNAENAKKNNSNNKVVNRDKDEYGPYKLNPWVGLGTDLFGAAMSAGQFIDAANQRISRPNFYVGNPTARLALSGLAGIRYNTTPIRGEMLDEARRNAYQLNNAGGLTAGLRYMGRISNMLGVNSQLAKLEQDAQQLNNGYRNAYYDALSKYGQQEQQARMSALQTGYNAYAAAHNAREEYKQLALRNGMDYLQGGVKNYNTAKMYNGMRSLYWQDLDNKELDALARLEAARSWRGTV